MQCTTRERERVRQERGQTSPAMSTISTVVRFSTCAKRRTLQFFFFSSQMRILQIYPLPPLTEQRSWWYIDYPLNKNWFLLKYSCFKDVSKSFDSISIGRLKAKLQLTFPPANRTLTLIKQIIDKNDYRVLHNGQESEAFKLRNEAPQGDTTPSALFSWFKIERIVMNLNFPTWRTI